MIKVFTVAVAILINPFFAIFSAAILRADFYAATAGVAAPKVTAN